jgi:hypothetical protein
MIAALYVAKGGCYFGLPDVDPWDEARDARKYAGPWPVVAHPPCARWCRLAGLVQSRYGIKKHEDGGCFAAALAAVRKWGGVLEHPAYSDAWAHFGLPAPNPSGGWQRGICGGWSCQVEQGHYGHRAPKPTWLYAYGASVLPDFIWGESDAEMGLNTWYPSARSDPAKRRKEVSKRERSATPPAFRDLLLSIARTAKGSAHAPCGEVVADQFKEVSNA